jgi:hypothetical protein
MMRKIFLILFTPVMVLSAEPKPLRVLVWDEQQPEQKKAYGDRFLGETIAAHLLTQPGLEVKSVSLADPEQGVSEALLDNSDVVIWWAHKRVSEFTEEHARRLVSRVVNGRLSLIALHSAHWSKPFVRLMQERAKADALAQVPEAEREPALLVPLLLKVPQQLLATFLYHHQMQVELSLLVDWFRNLLMFN